RIVFPSIGVTPSSFSGPGLPASQGKQKKPTRGRGGPKQRIFQRRRRIEFICRPLLNVSTPLRYSLNIFLSIIHLPQSQPIYLFLL
ncbi:MAG: hypothetical protein M3H12_13745, partial [Chromatiales bacterium]